MARVSHRRPALDGLRGIAAFVVLVHHCLLIGPSLAAGYLTGVTVPAGSGSWLALYTPLHLVWAGGEAVFVFFVLSGLVLALPAARGRGIAWRGYYPSRFVRLYAPIVAACFFALALVRLVPRHAPADSSWWLAYHRSPVGLRETLHDATVVQGPTWLNSALWSLQWEVIFSALLPLYVLLFVAVRRATIWRALALLALVVVGAQASLSALIYLPIFGLGVLMAQQLEGLDRLGRLHDGLGRPARALVAAAAGVLLVARWLIKPLSDSERWNTVGLVLTLLGACLVVWLFASTRGGERTGTLRPIRWLGTRSFSLYLVHEPIVVTVAYLLHGTRNPALVLPIAVPVSLLVAELFGRLCEAPSHRLAQRIGARLRSPATARPQPGVGPSGLAYGPQSLPSER